MSLINNRIKKFQKLANFKKLLDLEILKITKIKIVSFTQHIIKFKI